MKSFKIISLTLLFWSINSLYAEESFFIEPITITSANDTTREEVVAGCPEPETDDKLNSELLNTLPAVNILNLSGVDSDGVEIKRFMINTLPDTNAGTLYLQDAETEILAGQYLSIEESDGIRFDPRDNFEGNTSFTYSSVNSNDVIDSSPATVTLPIVAPVVNGVNCEDNETVVHDKNCSCSNYEADIPTFSTFGFLGMFILTVFLGQLFMRKEI